jgi:hypothetical protein
VFRSLPGPPCTEIEAPPPLVVGSGKSETPWLRMQWAYARSWAIAPCEDDAGVWLLLLDPAPGTPGPFEPPQPAASTASPSDAAIVAAVLTGSDRRRPDPRASLGARSGRCSWSDALVMCFSDVIWEPFRRLYASAPDTSLTEAVMPL